MPNSPMSSEDKELEQWIDYLWQRDPNNSHRKDVAKQALEAYVTRKQDEARIDEQNRTFTKLPDIPTIYVHMDNGDMVTQRERLNALQEGK